RRAAVRAAFLGEEGVIRVALAHRLDDFHLGLGVDLRDEIVLPLLANVDAMDAVHPADDDFTGPARGADGDIEQRLHVTRPRKRDPIASDQDGSRSGKERGSGWRLAVGGWFRLSPRDSDQPPTANHQ